MFMLRNLIDMGVLALRANKNESTYNDGLNIFQ